MAEMLDCLFSCDLGRLKLLLEKTGVNTIIPGTDGCTPLHILAGIETVNNKSNILSFLLENGADPNARSFENLTPVHIAAMWNNCYELEKLLQSGGNPWLTDSENKNSFDMAADNYSYEAYQLLNIYLAEDKLDFRRKRNVPNNLKTSDTVLDNPECFRMEKSEDSKHLSLQQYTLSSTFMTANEHFPHMFSSDENEDHVLNVSKFLKRKKCPPKGRNVVKNTVHENDIPSTSTMGRDQHDGIVQSGNQSKNSGINETKLKKAHTNNLNEAYLISSTESEPSESTTTNLNSSSDSNYETIIDIDDESGMVLVEMKSTDTLHSSVNSVGSDWKSYHNFDSDCMTQSYCSSHSESSTITPFDLDKYSNSKIFQELKNLGDNPGPVLDHTRQVYLNRLARLMTGCEVHCDLPKPKYCPEIYLFLENKLDMTKARILDQNIAGEFEVESDKKWREGSQRCCFNYFLLDPRVTQNLPQRASHLTTEQTFLTFLDALFYVGKGARGRPYSHLFEAAKALAPSSPKSDKINHILEIWNSGLGVISLHCFHNSIPVEAYTREASIIEAVGLENLTNVKKGDYYGLCAKLTMSRKRLIGISLLDRALKIFLLEGERYIKPKDIQKANK